MPSGLVPSVSHIMNMPDFCIIDAGDRLAFNDLRDPMIFPLGLITSPPGGHLYRRAQPTQRGPVEAADALCRRQGGFTLLELLVVLAILGMLIGLVGPALMRQFGSAKEKIAHLSIQQLESNLDMYKLDVGAYPTTDQGLQALITRPSGVTRWNGPYTKGAKVPEDPWGRPFVYHNPSQRPDHEYDLYSLGPTGQPGGTGDSATIFNE